LSAATTADTKKSLLLNGFARFPLTALYVLLGVVMLAVYRNSPDLFSQVPSDKPDYLVPQFILSKKATARSITAGIVSGVAFNLFLWVSMPDVFWMWWNLFGFVVAVGISYFISLSSAPSSKDISQYILP
jgi:Na+/proline symporter